MRKCGLLCSMVALQSLCLVSPPQVGLACTASYPFLPSPLLLVEAASRMVAAQQPQMPPQPPRLPEPALAPQGSGAS